MPEKILVVDDSSTDRLIIKNMLSDFEVLTANDGREAMQQIETHSDIDLIILDLNMPVMDGFQVLDALKNIDQKRRLRTIILTNYNELDKEIRGLKAGAVDFIRKPVNMESLRVRIGIHLELLKIQKLYEQTLYERSLTLNTVLDQAPVGIALSHSAQPGTGGEQTVFNAAYERITGRSREELIALGWAQITHPDDLPGEMALYKRFMAGEIHGYSLEKRFIKPDGSIVWAEIILAPLNRRSDIAYDHLCLAQDITERKSMEDALSESERSKSVLLSNLPGMAYRCDYDTNWTMRFVSDGCIELTGYLPESLIGNRDLSFNDIIVPEYREPLWNEWARMLSNRQPYKGEYEIITASGPRKWVLEMGQGVYDEESGAVRALEGIIIDITDRKMQEMQLKHISEIDSLTGLHNRAYLEQMLAADAAVPAEGSRAMVLLSLRKINAISLTYGYGYSEKIVKELSCGLLALADDNRALFQISLERFAFYIKHFGNAGELRDFCLSIYKIIDGIQILRTAECGIGVLEFDCNRCDAEEVILRASTAAERADESAGFGYRLFDREMETAAKREKEIKKALLLFIDGSKEAHLFMQFQPILNLKNNHVEEFEALARFRCDTLGAVSPIDFIPIAEENNMIIPLGNAVLDMSCAFQKRLETAGYGNIRIFVNFSVIQILRSDFSENFMQTLNWYGVAPEFIGIEITESMFVNSYLSVNEKLEPLVKKGVLISIDDFGTGYSSLSRERELRANFVKIDKSFIDKLITDRPDLAITEDIISMAHKMGHLVVAEGVEHETQKQYLADHGCDMMQGYLYSRPLDEDAAIAILGKQN
jgi:PAS domain S-box-containing protein